jgi:hypothetical protein
MRVNQAELMQAGLARTGTASDSRQTERSFGATLAATTAKKPKGEVTQAVAGHDYIEIVAGPRNGMFINKSGNERDGQAFVRKRGAEYDLHIYGEGKHREIVKVPHKGAAKQEATEPVEGRPYAEVTSGPRDGMFINKTSNERSGEAFVLVRRDDRDLHIYGSGKDRRVIVSWHKDRGEDKPDAVKETQQDPKLEAGGVAAPTTGV